MCYLLKEIKQVLERKFMKVNVKKKKKKKRRRKKRKEKEEEEERKEKTGMVILTQIWRIPTSLRDSISAAPSF